MIKGYLEEVKNKIVSNIIAKVLKDFQYETFVVDEKIGIP